VLARGAASAILVGAVLVGTTGCGFVTEQATLIQYEPSDGTAASIGGIDLRNVLAISEDGVDASIVFTAINSNAKGAFVNFQYTNGDDEKTDERVYVAGNSSVSIGNYDAGEDTLVLKDLDIVVGSLLPLYAQVGDAQGEELLVPVLDGSLGEYSTLVPVDSKN
jgi:hypothetical protein